MSHKAIIVRRTDVAAELEAWAAGVRTAAVVHGWVVARYSVIAFEPEDDVVNEVLSELDQLDVNLVTVDDVPSLLRALQCDAQDSVGASKIIAAMFEDRDIATRRRELRNDPFYSRFCE